MLPFAALHLCLLMFFVGVAVMHPYRCISHDYRYKDMLISLNMAHNQHLAGKTTSARVISTQAAVPLVYLPLEAVLSKWYGESEGQLAKVFKAAGALGGAIVFIVSHTASYTYLTH